MSKAHTVTVAEIEAWASAEAWYLAASSFGRDSDKKLEMSNARRFRVTENGDVTYSGNDMADAVNVYNAAR